MNEAIETKLIDTGKLTAEIDSYGEWINQHDIMESLVDEAAVLAIANSRVKDRILSISDSAKAVREENDKLRNRNYELESEIREANNKLSKLDEIAKQKATEMLKDVEREMYGYAKGDELFLIIKHHHYEKKTCKYCDGTGEIEVKGEAIKCPKCYNGEVSITVQDPCEIRKITIYSNSAVLYKEDETDYRFKVGTVSYSYKTGKYNDISYGELRKEDKTFGTREEAEEWIKMAEVENER